MISALSQGAAPKFAIAKVYNVFGKTKIHQIKSRAQFQPVKDLSGPQGKKSYPFHCKKKRLSYKALKLCKLQRL